MSTLNVRNERSTVEISGDYNGMKIIGDVQYNKDGLIYINGRFEENSTDMAGSPTFSVDQNFNISGSNANYKDAPERFEAAKLFVDEVIEFINEQNGKGNE